MTIQLIEFFYLCNQPDAFWVLHMRPADRTHWTTPLMPNSNYIFLHLVYSD